MADKTLITVKPPIKVYDNGDGTWSIGIEDVNSDSILAATLALRDIATLDDITAAIEALRVVSTLDTIEDDIEAVNAQQKLNWLVEALRSNIVGHTVMRGLGERDSIGTTAQGEDITRINELSATPASPASDTFIPRPAEAGEQLTVISESDADNGGSATGVLTMCVVYLDSSGNQQETTVTMNGQAAVDLTPSDVMFVQEMYALTVGSNTVSEGHIRIYKKTDATLVYNMIALGGNQSLVPHRMVPTGKTLYLREWMGSEMSNAKRTRIRLRADCTNAIPPVRQADVFLFKSVMALDGTGIPFPLAYAIPALSVVKVSAWAKVSGAEVAMDWWGILVDD